MTKKIVRSRLLITRVIDRERVEEVAEGALLIDNGLVASIGAFSELSHDHPDAEVIGSGNEVVLPGFVNAHHHIGLTPVQLGSPDMPLELWFVTRMVMRNVDLYLDTLYSAFEMIASGVTTVQHLHSWVPGTPVEAVNKCDQVIQAYHDIGMRVSYAYATRDQNRLVYESDEAFIARLPEKLRDPMRSWFARFQLSLEDSLALFRDLHRRHNEKERVRVQLAPANLHWCSDKALEMLTETSRSFNVPMHMHLVETAYQKAYAQHRGDCTALEYIDRFGMLGPDLTLGHGVWLTESDIERVAETGTCICHNCSSNLRLRSGVAALNAFEAAGIETALGMDEAGINDDRDMLQEMRLALRVHRVPGLDPSDIPTVPQVLRMATQGGARTTPYGDQIGSLEVGKAADLILIDWDAIAFPYLDANTSTLDAVVQRAKSDTVKTVICAGEIIYRHGVFTRVDRTAALQALHDELSSALSDEEVQRRELSQALLPHVAAFYRDYIAPDSFEPFYRQSSRV
ncbi:MAG: amidohydrolase family protein [Pseudomonadota bacterium]